MTEARCVICTGERQAHVGFLCLGHLERLGAMLREVEDQAAMLDARPSMQQRTGSGGGSLASERSPARLDVIVHTDPRSRQAGTRPVGPACPSCWHDTCTDIRAWLDAYDARATDTLSILDVLHSWARAVREDDERKLSPPDHITVSGERDLLTRQLPWIAAQPWVDECYTDLRELLGQLTAVNGTGPGKPVARCYLPADTESGRCGGNIWRSEQQAMPWITLADRCARVTMEAADGPAYCERCGSIWEGEAAIRRLELVAELEREAKRPYTSDGRKMLTAAEIARDMGITVNAVYLRLSRAKIRAVNGYYDPAALSLDVAS